MATEYIKRGNGKSVAGSKVESLSKNEEDTMLALTEIYEGIEKTKDEIYLALAEVYETSLEGGK